MSRRLWLIVRQYLVNQVVLIDYAGNAVLGGDPGELLSHRLAEARAAGSRKACVVCAVLSRLFDPWRWLLHKPFRDHCTWALDQKTDKTAHEVWNWGRP